MKFCKCPRKVARNYAFQSLDSSCWNVACTCTSKVKMIRVPFNIQYCNFAFYCCMICKLYWDHLHKELKITSKGTREVNISMFHVVMWKWLTVAIDYVAKFMLYISVFATENMKIIMNEVFYNAAFFPKRGRISIN